MMKLKSILTGVVLVSLLGGCTTEIDDDGLRSGALEVPIGENTVTNDELYPTAGDEIDWKMVFLPSPGDLIIFTHWDQGDEIFDVKVGIYDRFGIPIKVETKPSGVKPFTVRSFVPESGLHFIKLTATTGRSIYSINVRHEPNEDGFIAPETAPDFSEYLDFDAEMEAKGNASAGDKKKADKKADAAAPAAGGALPVAAAGGMALPTAAAGGMAAPSAPAAGGATIVQPAGDDGGVSYKAKTLNNNTGKASESESFKPICGDIKGKYSTINADVKVITSKGKGSQIKLNVGKKQGVVEGAVAELYVDGKILEGGRIKIESISDNSCTGVSNAPKKVAEKASKVVVKVPG